MTGRFNRRPADGGPSLAARPVNQVGKAAALVLALALAGCVTPGEETALPPVRMTAPEGAVAPAGLGDIRKGMSQKQVLRLLRPHHVVRHAADATPDAPLVDYFIYTEDGVTKFAEIFYDGDRVHELRFGYAEPLVLID